MLTKMLKTLSIIALTVVISACNGSDAKPSTQTTTEAQTQLQKIVTKGQIVVGTSGNMTPMTRSINEGRGAVGFDIDLAQTMADTMGVKLVVKVIAFEKLIPALENGEIDIIVSNMTITPQRNAKVAFVGPYLNSGKCLITKESALANAKKEELDKTKAKMVVLKGTTSEDFIRIGMPHIEAVTVDTQEEAIAMVRSGEVKAMLDEYPICRAIISNNPDEFVSVFSNLTYEPIGIAIAPQNTHLINWTQNFLGRANKVGLLEVLGKKWFR